MFRRLTLAVCVVLALPLAASACGKGKGGLFRGLFGGPRASGRTCESGTPAPVASYPLPSDPTAAGGVWTYQNATCPGGNCPVPSGRVFSTPAPSRGLRYTP